MINLPSYEYILRRLATILSVAILTLILTAATTGVLIAFYYQPTAGGAYDSIKAIADDIPYGWLFLGLHNFAGNATIVVALLQIIVMFLGRQYRRSWLTAWISGILLALSAIGLAWTSMILAWSQSGFWRFQIELGTIEAIPFIGSQLRDILTGGAGVGTTTVEHLYTLHSYILSVGALVLTMIHLGGLLLQENETKYLQLELSGILSNSEFSASQAKDKAELEKKF